MSERFSILKPIQNHRIQRKEEPIQNDPSKTIHQKTNGCGSEVEQLLLFLIIFPSVQIACSIAFDSLLQRKRKTNRPWCDTRSSPLQTIVSVFVAFLRCTCIHTGILTLCLLRLLYSGRRCIHLQRASGFRWVPLIKTSTGSWSTLPLGRKQKGWSFQVHGVMIVQINGGFPIHRGRHDTGTTTVETVFTVGATFNPDPPNHGIGPSREHSRES